MIDLNDRDVMSSTEAARRWHKADDYVRQMFRKTPWKFPEGTIRKFGKQLVITRRGMETVTGLTEAEAANYQYTHKSIPTISSFNSRTSLKEYETGNSLNENM